MDDRTRILPGIPPVAGKPVHVAFDGGRLTSDAGVLLLAAIEQQLGISQRLADCIEDPVLGVVDVERCGAPGSSGS